MYTCVPKYLKIPLKMLIVCGVRDKYQVYVYMMMIIQLASAISLDVRQMVLYPYATGGKQM